MGLTCHSYVPVPTVLVILLYDIVRIASCSNGDARLANGSSLLEGRVEVCADQGNYTQWGTVCVSLALEKPSAVVVCQQLHLADKNTLFDSVGADQDFGPGTLPIVLYNPRCSTDMSRNLLNNCSYSTRITKCRAAGVTCPGNTTLTILDVKPGRTSVQLQWSLLRHTDSVNLSHYEIECSTNKGQSLTYKTSAIVYGNTHNMIELEGLQPSSNYNCCVTAYTMENNGNQVYNQSCVNVETSMLPPHNITPSQCQVTSVVSKTMFVKVSLSPTDSYGTTTTTTTTSPTGVQFPQTVCENFIVIVAGSSGGGVVCTILFLLIFSCFCLICCRRNKSPKRRSELRFGDNLYNNNKELSVSPLSYTPTSNHTCETTLNNPTEPMYAPLTDFPASPNGNLTHTHDDGHTPDQFELHTYDMPSCLAFEYSREHGSQRPNGDVRHANRTGSLEARNRRFDMGSFDDIDSEEPKNHYHVLEEPLSASSTSAAADWPIHAPPPVQRELKPPARRYNYESTEDLFHIDPSVHNQESNQTATQLKGHQAKVENVENFYHVLEGNTTSRVNQRVPATRSEGTDDETNGATPEIPKLISTVGDKETEPLYHVLEESRENSTPTENRGSDRTMEDVETTVVTESDDLEATNSD